MGLLSALFHLESFRRIAPSWLKPQNATNFRFLLSGILLGFSFSLTTASFVLYFWEKKQREILSRFKPRPIELRNDEIVQGINGLIGKPIFSRVVSYAS
jgi:cysteine synthase